LIGYDFDHLGTCEQGLKIVTFNHTLPTTTFSGVSYLFPPLHLWHLFHFKAFLWTRFNHCTFTSNKNFILWQLLLTYLTTCVVGLVTITYIPTFPTWPRGPLHKILSLVTIFPKQSVFTNFLTSFIYFYNFIIYVWLLVMNYLATYDQGLAIATFNPTLPISTFSEVPDLPPLHLWHLFPLKVCLPIHFSCCPCTFPCKKNFIFVATAAYLLGNLWQLVTFSSFLLSFSFWESFF